MTSVSGLKKAGELVKPYLGKVPIFLWGSLPCTLGSSFQQINKWRSPRWETRKTFLTEHFIALHDNFIAIAELVSSHAGGHVAYEWPTGCSLWKEPRIVSRVNMFKMRMVNINGCMLGLKSPEGNLLRSLGPLLLRLVNSLTCSLVANVRENTNIRSFKEGMCLIPRYTFLT